VEKRNKHTVADTVIVDGGGFIAADAGGADRYLELVKKARAGDRTSRNRLAEIAWAPLKTYVYRRTLDEDLTEDIVQESIVEMFRVLGKLNSAEKFWPWLCKIALNHVRGYYRKDRRRRKLAADYRAVSAGADGQKALADIVSRELQDIVKTAMRRLRLRHREVLVMRCYEGKDYGEIADVMGCSELSARLLFFRAKKSLQKHLARNGLSRKALLSALVVFGKMTAHNEAAAAGVSVTAATTNVGVAAGIIGSVTGKGALIAVTTAAALSAGTVVLDLKPGPDGQGPVQKPSGSYRTAGAAAESGRNLQRWYFFPKDAEGVVMMREMAFDEDKNRLSCRWLQNASANYRFRDRNKITIENHRFWNEDLTVMRLPTDDPKLSGFLLSMENGEPDFPLEHVSGGRSELLVIAELGEGPAVQRVIPRYDISEEEYFRYEWPASARMVDNRDAVHRRGWGLFQVEGHVKGSVARGTGQIPFVYEQFDEHPPRLQIEFGGVTIVDGPQAAGIYDAAGRVLETRPPGSFFAGLVRPWTGLHCIDTVRRDAADRSLAFESRYIEGRQKAEVTVKAGAVRLTYALDMARDFIESITITKQGQAGSEALLRFMYPQDAAGRTGAGFTRPAMSKYRRPADQSTGMLWLVELIEGEGVFNSRMPISDL